MDRGTKTAEPTGAVEPKRPASDATRASRGCHRFAWKVAPPLGLRRVLTQVCHDLCGTKDVQNATTASYVWMADQLRHMKLGIVSTLLWCGLWRTIWQGNGVGLLVGYLFGTALIFGYWIYKNIVDFRDTKARAGGIFPFGSGGMGCNVRTASLYFAIGCALGVAAFLGFGALLITLAVTLWPGLRVALWWLRRKLAFQQAGLPYPYRLANFNGSIIGDVRPVVDTVSSIANLPDRIVLFWRVRFGPDPIRTNDPPVRHLLVTGPLRSGKTSLAVGIGTEFAFTLGIGRYLSGAELMQQINGDQGKPDQLDYDDGRELWPWRTVDLLIIDDVDEGLIGATQAKPVQPGELKEALMASRSASPLAWLGKRRSVWVTGDPSGSASWNQVIADLLNVGVEDILTVKLAT